MKRNSITDFARTAQTMEIEFGNVEHRYQTQSFESSIDRMVRQQQESIERHIKSAICSGKDGVDVYYRSTDDVEEIRADVHKIEAWSEPAPDVDERFRVVRYTWDWFDQERLQKAIRKGELDELVEELVQSKE